MRKIETRKTAVISISHMQATDEALLEQGIQPAGLLFAGDYGYGFNTFIDEENWQALGLTREFYANAILAMGFDRVEFDRDAESVEGLPKFDW